MKLFNQLALIVCPLLISSLASGLAGRQALGDGAPIEYPLAAGATVFAG